MSLQSFTGRKLVRLSVNIVLLITLAALSVWGQSKNQGDAQELPQNQPVERELTGGQTHIYRVNLAVNEFLQVRVEQKGVDISIKLYGPQRELLAQMDSPNAKEGPETLSWVAGIAGECRIEISPLEKEGVNGRYSVRRVNRREATAQDRRRVSVERVFMEALSARGAAEDEERAKAMPKFREALRGWEELQDAYMAELTTEQIQQTIPDIRPLEGDETIERGLPEGDAHQYFMVIKKGQAVSFRVEEKGVDVVARFSLIRTTESHFFAMRDFGDGFERESITYISEYDGVGVLTLKTFRPVMSSGLGKYRLTLQSNKIATQSDIQRSRAEQLLDDASGASGNLMVLKEAITKLKESLSIWQTLGEKYWMGYTNIKLGTLYWRMSDNHKAITSYIAASDIFEEIGDQWSLASVYTGMSQSVLELGENQRAHDLLRAALEIFESFHDTFGEAGANSNIGRVYFNSGLYQEALPFLEKALAQARALNNREIEYISLASIGGSYLGLNKPREAEGALKQALQLASAVNDRYAMSITMHNLAEAYKLMDNRNQARAYFQQALLYEKMTGNGLAAANSFYSLASFWETTNPRLAIFFGKQAVNGYQELRSSIQQANNETQKEFLRSVEGAYRHLVDLLISQGRLAEAQQALNAYKDQQIFDLNPATTKKPPLLALTPRETLVAREYQKTGERINSLGEQLFKERAIYRDFQTQAQLNAARNPNLGKPDRASDSPAGQEQPDASTQIQDQRSKEISARIEQLEAEEKNASDSFLAVFKQAEAEFSEPVSEKDNVGEVADKSEMQSALRALNQETGSKTVALYTFIGEKYYRVLMVTPERVVEKSIPIVEKDFHRKIIEFWDLLRGSDVYDPRPLGKQLYDILFAPIEEDVKREKAETLLWSLDGTLRYISVAALHDGKQYMVERYRNLIFTRASKERLISVVSKKWTGIGLGTSNAQTVEILGDKLSFVALPGVTTELEQIFGGPKAGQGILKGDVLIDGRFTFGALRSGLQRRPSVVHIASHFQFSAGDEARSFLLLGDGKLVTLEQLKEYPDLFQGVELLTLSACNTGAQQPGAHGREIDGFAELAQRQGAGAVMASLWAVTDVSTAELMATFYKGREQQGLSKAEALRRAQVALLNGSIKDEAIKGDRKRSEVVGAEPGKITAPRFIKDPTKPFAHPYYWSPFVLIGNGK